MRVLERTQFGNPILRKAGKKVTLENIKSKRIQKLITDMRHTLVSKKLGIGLAGPQVNVKDAIAVIAIRKTPTRPKVKPFDLTVINPQITNTFGMPKEMWEGCISSGPAKNGLFAKVPRYSSIKVKFYDEKAQLHHLKYQGLPAQVIQHEIDHLNGILFVDRVQNPKTFMTYEEYMTRIVKKEERA